MKSRLAQIRSAECDRRTKAQLQDEFGTAFHLLDPDWFATFTFEREPTPSQAVRDLTSFLTEIQEEAGRPIAWVLAQGLGKETKRLHYHALICGVGDLNRHRWWQKAHARFGRCQILPYDPEQAGAYYVAMNGLSKGGEFHFGGAALDQKWAPDEREEMEDDVRALTMSRNQGDRQAQRDKPSVGRQVIVHSADLTSEFFGAGLGRGRR